MAIFVYFFVFPALHIDKKNHCATCISDLLLRKDTVSPFFLIVIDLPCLGWTAWKGKTFNARWLSFFVKKNYNHKGPTFCNGWVWDVIAEPEETYGVLQVKSDIYLGGRYSTIVMWQQSQRKPTVFYKCYIFRGTIQYHWDVIAEPEETYCVPKG